MRYAFCVCDPGGLIRAARIRSGLSRRALAQAAGTSRAALDQIEKGERIPRIDTLNRIVGAAGFTLELVVGDAGPQPSDHVTSLGQASVHLDPYDPVWNWRWLISGFVAGEFVPASKTARACALADQPGSTDDPRWDTFLAALAEHLSFHAHLDAPSWTTRSRRKPLEPFWWPVHGDLPSQRSAALAFSPASFKARGILVDGREIPRITP